MNHDETKLPRWAWVRLCQYRKALMQAFERIREMEGIPEWKPEDNPQEIGQADEGWNASAWCEIEGVGRFDLPFCETKQEEAIVLRGMPKDSCGNCAYWLSGICALDDSRKAPETAGCSQFAKEIFIKFI